MRRVKVEYHKRAACVLEKFNVEGNFHRWGEDFEEFDSGAGNYTVAIVELDDGSVVQVVPSDVQFIDSSDSKIPYALETIELALNHHDRCECDCMDHRGVLEEAKSKLS